MGHLAVREYWLEPPEYIYPTCPVCGNECETFYFNNENEICGCDQCVSTRDASEYKQEQYEEEKEAWQSRYDY